MKPFCLTVTGDYACFTRPELKTERLSYDVITPSAARAIFEAVFWKPSIRWRIQKIDVLRPIRWISVRRNEVASVVPYGNVKSAMKSGTGTLGIYIEEDRQQRAGRFLRDVAYRLYATLEVVPGQPGAEDGPGKYYAMFERRAKQGQTFNQPYLGCREFSACVAWADPDDPAQEAPISESRDFGLMLYDMDFSHPQRPPRFFNAQMVQGVIKVPAWESEEVRG
ncbi:MAG: type I-C CRISPR-associated protein Cas5 [Vampirovibrionales bacterium]|nr:type I-C CRISPR-associated protein Cas5 [Vampirovibrionales bacterium]